MRIILFAALLALLSCRKNNSGGSTPQRDISEFTRVEGGVIKDSNNNTIRLRGVAFGNQVYLNNEVPTTHHDETDFQRLQSMHMNAIRFYMNYRTFESDNSPYKYKQTGWDWLDKNIAWAKKYGIYLVLNMHFPQGGYQSGGTGDALWSNTEDQNRLTALWKEIAKRYKNETAIAGFGLVNEPVPVNTLQQWQQLAQKITTAIREEDKNHIVFIEKPIYIKGTPGEDANLNFPVISDNNMAYEFHFYDPHAFTHQLFDWANTGDGGKYPDENIISLSNGTWYTATIDNPTLPAGNSNWTEFQGIRFKITDPKIKVGMPALVAANASGKVYFDNIVIKEFDEQNNFTRNILQLNLNDQNGWSYWSSNNSGDASLSGTTGVGDDSSIVLSGGTGDCNVTNYTRMFVPKMNYSYQIDGWMKGENIASNAYCQLRIDFLTSNEPVYKRDKEFLRSILKRYYDFAQQKNIPVYMGEFGAGSPCFQNNKGGLQWVSDMIDLAEEYNMHYTYHSYHESSFGLYLNDDGLPDPAHANQGLIDLFTEKLN